MIKESAPAGKPALALLANELKLLCRSKFTFVLVTLTVVISAVGLNALDYSNQVYLNHLRPTPLTLAVGTAAYGAAAGSVLFAVLSLLTVSRDERQRSRELIDIRVEYGRLQVLRTAAVLVCGVIAALLSVLSTAAIMAAQDLPPDFSTALYTHGIVLLASIVFSILLVSGFYLVSGSMDVSFLLFAGLYLMGITSSDYLLNWVRTTTEVYSDFAGIGPVTRLMVYNRLLWLSISTGVFTAGLLTRRRYGLGLAQSLRLNLSSPRRFRPVLPLVLVMSILLSAAVYINEPYIDSDSSLMAVEKNVDADVKLEKVTPEVVLFPEKQQLAARVGYEFSKKPGVEHIDFITNRGLDIESVMINGSPSTYQRLGETDKIRIAVPPGERATVELNYRGTVKYPVPAGFPGYITPESVYLQEGSYWVSEPLTEKAAMVETAGSVTAPADLTVIPVGKLDGVEERGGVKVWRYSAQSQAGEMALYAGRYEMKTLMVDGTRVELYYSPRHREYIESSGLVDYLRRIVKYYQENIGAYPFSEYPLKIVETSIYKPGGHSTLNLVSVAESMFNRRETAADPAVMTLVHDLSIIAHEIAHQWWGSGAAVELDTPWSSEGLAEYYSYKYIQKELPGMSEYLVAKWRHAVERQKKLYYVLNPEVKQTLPSERRRKIDMETLKTELYYQMPFKLLEAEKDQGEAVFMRKLSELYKNNRQQVLTYQEFLALTGLAREGTADE